jgi:ferritin-like metal-binding protein YciE
VRPSDLRSRAVSADRPGVTNTRPPHKEKQIAMADMNERDAKLVQYLNEAYGKERELETALQAHILMTSKGPYQKRLKQHLKETKSHAKHLDRRIKKLGGGVQTLQTVVGKATAAAKGPLHAIRGDGAQEKMLKNAKTEYFNEHEEIATYLAIETLAERVGDKETAQLARGIRREEERMAKFLEGQIKSLSKAVAMEDIPAAQRRTGSPARRKKASGRGAAKAKPAARAKSRTAKKSTAKRTAKKSTAKKSTAKKTARKSGGKKTSASRAKKTTRSKRS